MPLPPAPTKATTFKQRQAAKREVRLQTLRQHIGYEDDVPRCLNCKEFRPKRSDYQGNGKWIETAQHCDRFHFRARVDGCCDYWTSHKGEKLESLNE